MSEITSRVSCWRCGGRMSYPVARIVDGEWVSAEKPCRACRAEAASRLPTPEPSHD